MGNLVILLKTTVDLLGLKEWEVLEFSEALLLMVQEVRVVGIVMEPLEQQAS